MKRLAILGEVIDVLDERPDRRQRLDLRDLAPEENQVGPQLRLAPVIVAQHRREGGVLPGDFPDPVLEGRVDQVHLRQIRLIKRPREGAANQQPRYCSRRASSRQSSSGT